MPNFVRVSIVRIALSVVLVPEEFAVAELRSRRELAWTSRYGPCLDDVALP